MPELTVKTGADRQFCSAFYEFVRLGRLGKVDQLGTTCLNNKLCRYFN